MLYLKFTIQKYCFSLQKKEIMVKGKNETAHFFIKFGRKDYMENLLYKGEVFLNTIKYYHECDLKEIGDENEGLIRKQLPDICKINGIDCYATNVRLSYNDLDCKNLYCLYCIKDGDVAKGININKEYIVNLSDFSDFGDYCVIIHDLKAFVQRLEVAIRERGLKLLDQKAVCYVDLKNYSGEINHFVKDKRYAHQQEYRFLVENVNNESVSVHLGNLGECAKLLPVTKILKINF